VAGRCAVARIDHGWLPPELGGAPVARGVDDTPELRNTVAFSATGIHLFPNAELAVKMMKDGAEAGVFASRREVGQCCRTCAGKI
jgi:glucose-6-phosphate dehydrogenase assembly protein OpcA